MENNKTLFDLTGEFARLNDFLNDFDGDISDADMEWEIDRIFCDLDLNREQIKQKVDGYIAVIAENEALAEVRMNEAKRLVTLAQRNSANVDKLREKLLFTMKHVLNIEKLDTPFHSLKVSKAGGKRAMVLNEQALNKDCDPDHPYLDAIQDSYIKLMPPRPAYKILDTDAVRAALEEGYDFGFAQLKERKDVLKIK